MIATIYTQQSNVNKISEVFEEPAGFEGLREGSYRFEGFMFSNAHSS